jgi:hypothetical protein
MRIRNFEDSLSADAPPEGLGRAVQGLWWDLKGEWGRAHEAVQDGEGADSAWVHAFLHRKEGDLGNASYWYRRAGRTPPSTSLDEERRDILRALLRD